MNNYHYNRSAFISAASSAGEVAEGITPLGYSGGYERKIRLSQLDKKIFYNPFNLRDQYLTL